MKNHKEIACGATMPTNADPEKEGQLEHPTTPTKSTSPHFPHPSPT